ncbi:hypothetical protein H8356DRAFT_1352510 [Neocallimastix lanati (nom. inval.)]|nr:hypothetical protein H8356DRAFT_1352510 [Neocallimastix sp. JGI-2020a]
MNHLNYFNGISIYSNHYYEDWGKINILQIITTTTNNNNNSNKRGPFRYGKESNESLIHLSERLEALFWSFGL